MSSRSPELNFMIQNSKLMKSTDVFYVSKSHKRRLDPLVSFIFSRNDDYGVQIENVLTHFVKYVDTNAFFFLLKVRFGHESERRQI